MGILVLLILGCTAFGLMMVENGERNAQYQEEKAKVSIPATATKTSTYYVWVENNNFYCFPCRAFKGAVYGIKSIAVEKIHFYKQSGDLITETYGSGGGSNGNGRTSPISVNTYVSDSRKTELFYNDEGYEQVLVFAHDDFVQLKLLLPDKGYNFVESLKISKASKEQNTDIAIEDKLRKLNSLFESSLITEIEYETKRKELLANL